ncbi:UNVERIFIED_CONTAM: hypothetical protein GTU68_061004 [Idotea baltica]|nr:hypothetical protein [Idotea baltica]
MQERRAYRVRPEDPPGAHAEQEEPPLAPLHLSSLRPAGDLGLRGRGRGRFRRFLDRHLRRRVLAEGRLYHVQTR